MKRIFLAALLVFTLALAGCGDGSSVPPPIVTDILSDPTYDGYISQDPTTGAFTVTQGNPLHLFAGVDPATGLEYRAFLDFPLSTVPFNANIASATLSVFVNDFQPRTSPVVPVEIDLVAFQPLTLAGTDFTLPPIASRTVPFYPTDVNNYVLIDMTSLLLQAQILTSFTDFQVRILVPGTPGFIEIDDTTTTLAPLLEVAYF